MPRPRLPRVRPGQPITAAMFNALCDAVEANWLSAAAGDVTTAQGAGGVALSVDVAKAVMVKVSADIAAGTTSAPTKGSGTLRTFDGTNYSDTTISRDIYNYWDKTVKSGATAVCLPLFGRRLHIVDVRSCTDTA